MVEQMFHSLRGATLKRHIPDILKVREREREREGGIIVSFSNLLPVGVIVINFSHFLLVIKNLWTMFERGR